MSGPRKGWRRVARFAFDALSLLLMLSTLALLVCFLLNLRTPSATNLMRSGLLTSPPPPLSQELVLKVVTFNIKDMYWLSEHRPERMRAIGEKLVKLKPDLVGFQEAFIARDRELLLETIAEAGLTHHRYFRSGLVGSGLLIASRFPIAESHFYRYAIGGKPWRVDHGDWWAGKGVALVRVELPEGAGFVDFFNTHAHARYGGDAYNSIRLSQMAELAAYYRAAATGTSPAVCLGDFNCQRNQGQYSMVVEGAGLERAMRIDSRVDHIFVIENPRYTFDTLITQAIDGEVDVGDGSAPLSDHSGYYSAIRVRPRQAEDTGKAEKPVTIATRWL